MIVIATCQEWPQISDGLNAIVDALRDMGQTVECLPWQHEDIAVFCMADLVLPLCAWDYAKTPSHFQNWLESVEHGGGRVLNNTNTLLWNMNKSYLLDLAKEGLPITPTQLLKNPTMNAVQAALRQNGWDDAVLKPVYGQSGNQVQRFSPDLTDDDDIFQNREGILLQPFMKEIETIGEHALCFIDGQFSHAVNRMPAKGEWRANSQYNVSVTAIELEQAIIDQAAQYLEVLPETPLYARVDGLITTSGFVLSELELVEPALFFDKLTTEQHDKASTFAKRIIKRI